jgi:hypothetical protein
MILNILLLIVAAAAALTGFAGKNVDETSSGPIAKRIHLRGWVNLCLIAIALVLGIIKERTSFEGLVRNAYPSFYSAVEQTTGYDAAEWTQYISYRLTLRFLMQELFKREHPDKQLPEALEQTLTTLVTEGVITQSLCKKLNLIRVRTYTAEWARIPGPVPKQLAELRATARPALKELEGLVISSPTYSIGHDQDASCVNNNIP